MWQTSLHNPNFAKYAQICGGLGIQVTKKEELDNALAEAVGYEGAALVEIIADPELI